MTAASVHAALDESARHLDREFRTFLNMVEKAQVELAAAHEYLATLKG